MLAIMPSQALPEDGKLIALDKDERSMAVARKYWDKAGVRHKVCTAGSDAVCISPARP